MTLRLLLAWLGCLCLGAGLALSGPATMHAQITDHQLSDQNDPANPLRPLQFQTQVGLRIASPAFTRAFTPTAADLGSYLAVCWQASDATNWHCTP